VSIEEAIEQAVARAVAKVIHEVRASGERPALQLLTVREAADVARVSEATIRAWIRDGMLPRCGSAHVTRVRMDDLLAVRPKPTLAETPVEELAAELMHSRKRR
jgi:excisionase family DNA binding protein